MSPISVAYQGEPGAYSELAALNHFGAHCVPMGFTDFDQVFDAVTKGACDYGCVPVENTLGGSIHRNYDLLMRHALHCVGEVVVPIRWFMYALPGTELGDVQRVISHWQTLAQCERSLDRLLPGITRKDVYDNAGAVKMLIEQNLTDHAAIAGARAGQIYKVPVIASGLEDDPSNATRFVILSRSVAANELLAGEVYKTSIVFALHNVPGALHKAMAAFALRDIDLCKIESRPLQGSPFEYLFYIDLIGHIAQPHFARALANLQEYTTIYRNFGSFARAR